MPASQGLTSADSGEPTGAVTPADALGESKRMSTESAKSQESYECPTCGKELPTKQGMRSHHARVHGEKLRDTRKCQHCGDIFEIPPENKSQKYCSRECSANGTNLSGKENNQYNRVDVECDNCGETLERQPNSVEGKDHIFCDMNCKAEWQSENIRGNSHPLTNRVHETCHHCGSELSLTPFEKQRSERHYCDIDCVMAWRRKNGHLTKEDNPNWDGGNHVTVECAVCGDECDRRRDEVAENTTGCHFCSLECQGKWQSENWAGEDHPNWEGGKLNRNEYGPGWTQAKREAVRERDDYCCQGCGMQQQEHQDVFGAKLDVHHIRPAREFDDPQKRNAMDNLVSFCRSCHMKWEGIPLRPQ